MACLHEAPEAGCLLCLDPAACRLEVLVRGVFAGNLFDLGAAASAQHYKSNGTADFATTRSQLLPRPWVVDDLDALLQRFASEPSYAKAIMFVDNAGARLR